MKEGWKTSTLGDVLAVLRNGVNCKQDKSGKGDRVSRIESISAATFDLDKVGYAKLSERDKERYRLQQGDILFSHINSAVHVGKTAVFDSTEPVYHGVNLLLMRPGTGVTSVYLEYALKFLFQSGYWRGVCKQSVNQASVNQQDISRAEISYPESLPEQQRIVGILDEAFAEMARAKENAEKNLQNARELFESHLNAVFTQKGEGWVERTLGSVTTKIGSGATPRGGAASYKAEGISLIRSLNVHDLEFKYAKLAFLDDAQADALANVEVQSQDVLLNITGASVARCVLVPEDVLPARVNQHVSIIRPLTDKLNSAFLHYLLISKPYKDQLLKTGEEGGSTRQAITKAQIQRFSVDYPATVKEQETIVAKLDAMLAETQRLASIYERKLAGLEELKKSLLYQAFNGEL